MIKTRKMERRSEFSTAWKDFWKEIPWQFKALWASALLLGISVVVAILWLAFKLVNSLG